MTGFSSKRAQNHPVVQNLFDWFDTATDSEVIQRLDQYRTLASKGILDQVCITLLERELDLRGVNIYE